ncbi:MAG: ankyrin repeat domain-containing protein, partial [Bacteroidota bacterium]
MEKKLSNAIISGDLDTVRSYIADGGKFEGLILLSPDGYGKKPIELAALSQIHHNGSAQMTKLIKENSSEEDNAKMLVSFASEDINLGEVEVLLESGVFIDSIYQNETALQRATGNRNLKMVHLLLTHGADPKKDGEYGTALENAEKIYDP